MMASFAARSMPHRLFGHEVFAGFDGRAAHLLVQVMRHGHVDRFDGRIGQQLAVVLRALPDGGEVLAKPIERRRIPVRTRPRSPVGPACPSRWHHRAAALANSRPISPHPMIPKRTIFIALPPRRRSDLRCKIPLINRAALSWKIASMSDRAVMPSSSHACWMARMSSYMNSV